MRVLGPLLWKRSVNVIFTWLALSLEVLVWTIADSSFILRRIFLLVVTRSLFQLLLNFSNSWCCVFVTGVWAISIELSRRAKGFSNLWLCLLALAIALSLLNCRYWRFRSILTIVWGVSLRRALARRCINLGLFISISFSDLLLSGHLTTRVEFLKHSCSTRRAPAFIRLNATICV